MFNETLGQLWKLWIALCNASSSQTLTLVKFPAEHRRHTIPFILWMSSACMCKMTVTKQLWCCCCCCCIYRNNNLHALTNCRCDAGRRQIWRWSQSMTRCRWLVHCRSTRTTDLERTTAKRTRTTARRTSSSDVNSIFLVTSRLSDVSLCISTVIVKVAKA